MQIPSLNEIRNQERKYNVVVLCGGIGGSAIGYEFANFHVRAVVDRSPKAFESHQINIPHIPFLQKQVADILQKDIRDPRDEIDVLDIYIPTPHIDNKPSAENEEFFLHAMRTVYDTKSKVVIIHTKGRYEKGKKLLMINEWISLLRMIGYNVQKETLKTSNYGIAQEKNWTFIVGVRKDIGFKPVFPEAKEDMVSTKEAIGDLLKNGTDIEINPVRLNYVLQYFPPGCSYAQVKKIVDEQELGINPAYYKRDRWEEPYYGLSNSSVRPFHPAENRLMSIREAMRLQTFPDDFVCSDWREVCSAVPPLLIKQVAESLKWGLLEYL